ncbi:MAG TPA: uracil-DNA glycosylase [Terracidiphilus sp.]|nr:uracil-DNA glycosylase [Terracidiphilus sp.]
MARPFDPATREALLARVRFYRDLGLTEFYRRPVDPALLAAGPIETLSTPEPASEAWDTTSQPATLEVYSMPIRKPFSPPPDLANAVPAADRAAALQLIREDIGDCTRCALHKGRNKIVFGDGSSTARLMFVGEGPGADEDAQGIPFVGKAGQLLNNMIAAMGLKREEVYIANVVKCRPPGNRTPEPDEGNTCSPFLFRQIDVVRPEVLVALGATAATYLLGQRQPLAGLRGRVHAFRGMQLIITYHPAYLLRDPRQKKEAWADLQIAMRELGLKPPARS